MHGSAYQVTSVWAHTIFSVFSKKMINESRLRPWTEAEETRLMKEVAKQGLHYDSGTAHITDSATYTSTLLA
jgi:hypothetical protein